MFSDIDSQLSFVDLGQMDYHEAYKIQRATFESLINKKKGLCEHAGEVVYFVEHFPVYTLGLHAAETNVLRRVDAEYIRIERGGDVTFHGPGQLVIYPVLDLEHYHLGVKEYVHLLEETVIRILSEYGINAGRDSNAPGVWIDVNTLKARKICAVGIKCSRYVSMHGLALNVNTDLSWFSNINPCGFVEKGVTSIEAEGIDNPDMDNVKYLFKKIFSNLLIWRLQS